MARSKTVFSGMTIGPDVELLLTVAGLGIAAYMLWTKYGSTALTGIESSVSNVFGSGSAADSSAATDSGDTWD